MVQLFPLPMKRGEGGERRSREPGEGLVQFSQRPLTRLASLGTLSPLRGARAQPPAPANASGKNMSRQLAGGLRKLPVLAMKSTNARMPPTRLL